MFNNNVRDWNSRGIIPGPGESRQDYFKRGEGLLKKSSDSPSPIPEEHLRTPLNTCWRLFGVTPDWVVCYYSNRQLASWHGGATLYEEEGGQTIDIEIQLRQAFKYKDSYLGIYSRDEILAHELVHAGRMAFPDSCFDEFLAYRTSSSSLRKFLGPLFTNSIGAVIFLSLIVLALLFQMMGLIIDAHWFEEIVWGVQLLPLGVVAYALGKLLYRHHHLHRCKSNLECAGVSYPWHVIYRLSDKEIYLLSQGDYSKIKSLVENYAHSSLRWQMIVETYFLEVQ
ncbi:MAG: hypothetical protein ACQEP8_01185 [Chlamydiota bacterium]